MQNIRLDHELAECTEKITTNRLTLRPIEKKDAESIFQYRSDIIVNKYQGWIPKSIDEVDDFIANKVSRTIDVTDTWFQFVIIISNENKLIGDIGIHFIGTNNMQVEIGCTIRKDFQGKGYATEALEAIIHFLFTTLKKHRIIASADPRNTASIRLVERLGFKKEAHFKESLLLHGEWVDDSIFAILKKDWVKG